MARVTSIAAGPATPALWPGSYQPLGSTWTAESTNFAVFAPEATWVQLCLFDEVDGADTERRYTLTEQTLGIWHGAVPGISPGQRYGFRADGPWDPARGRLFNPAKLLLDPYARAVSGSVVPDGPIYSYIRPATSDPDRLRAAQLGRGCTADSAPYVAKSVVVHDEFDWGDDDLVRPRTKWTDTVIYELHVKGFTKTHTEVPESLRGTYAGLTTDAAVHYLKDLGVTTVELLPVHQFVPEPDLAALGLTNYWGYNSIGYFAPHNAYSSTGDRGQQINEFKGMVKALHRAGLEVILDVVYNHTAEGNHLGPMLSMKGVDNAAYYRLSPEDPHFYMDFTGTGNTLNVVQPAVLRMIMDSLRYFVEECHVDGFRFDLASALARQLHDVDRLSAFFETIQQDPVLSQVKLIAEPWDVGPGGYQVGNFPVLWSEWNGIYRDTMRDFWRGQADGGEVARRLTGSGG